MKIALELQPCCGNRSGIGIYTYELAKRLSSNNDIQISGNLFNFLKRNNNSNALEDIFFPINVNTTIPYGVYRRLWHILPISYSNFFPEGDITHFFNYIVPQKINGKVITTIYDLSYLLYPETLNSNNLKRIKKDISYSIQRSDTIITISENSKKELIEYLGIDENKIKIIYCGISQISSNLTLKYLQDKFKFEQNYILYVGNIEPRKNIPSLLLAYHKLKKEYNIPFQLIIAGQKGWSFDSIFETVSKYELTEHVIFTDYISDDDKSALYKNASLFVFPSLYEGFGIPILEAMSAGTPVVCSNTSSMPEVAGDAALLVNPTDIDELASSMYKLLFDENIRKEKIALGKIQANKFSWEKSASDLMDIYKELF